MGQRRKRRFFTAAESAEIWDRWRRGEGLKPIGRVFGKTSSRSSRTFAQPAAFGRHPDDVPGLR